MTAMITRREFTKSLAARLPGHVESRFELGR